LEVDFDTKIVSSKIVKYDINYVNFQSLQ